MKPASRIDHVAIYMITESCPEFLRLIHFSIENIRLKLHSILSIPFL